MERLFLEKKNRNTMSKSEAFLLNWKNLVWFHIKKAFLVGNLARDLFIGEEDKLKRVLGHFPSGAFSGLNFIMPETQRTGTRASIQLNATRPL